MVAIARAIGFKAKLVIMDEPTSSLDEREVSVLFDVIRQLKAEGVSVIFVSHKLDELYAVCDRVTIMRDGRTVRTADMKDIGKLELVASMLEARCRASRQKRDRFRRPPRTHRRCRAAATNLSAGHKVHDVSFKRAARRNRRARRLARARDAPRTARLVFGADPMRAGSLSLEGRPFDAPRTDRRHQERHRLLLRDRKLEGIIPDMAVSENLTLALMPQLTKAGIVDEAKQRAVVEKFIQRLGVKCSGPDQKIRELSGGNQQKVLLARWLAMNPKLLILDEPTRGIDVGAKAEIQSLIKELADQGLAVLMISPRSLKK